MPSVAVRIDETTKARLKAIAQAEDRTPHYLMKAAIEAYVEQREREIEDERVSIERWEEYKRTGISIPGEEVFAWIDSLAEGLSDEDSDAA